MDITSPRENIAKTGAKYTRYKRRFQGHHVATAISQQSVTFDLPHAGRCQIVKRPFFTSLRTRLIVLILVAATPALGFIIHSSLDLRKQAEAECP